MNFSELAHTITGKSLDECSLEELEQLARTYPYFSPLQFLYFKKKQAIDANAGVNGKVALYHHDILVLDKVLQPSKYESEINFPQEPEVRTVQPVFTEEKPEIEEILPEDKSVKESEQVTKEIPVLTIQPSSGELTFEPYHMVDYFASQGIKLSRDEESKDQFGKQLKSFTDWLKTMKKLPVSQMVAHLDSNSEHKVMNLAQHSVDDSNVVTEAMAEVWVKQGNIQKAIAIYNKLSLQNPSKKPYFAALIEKLQK